MLKNKNFVNDLGYEDYSSLKSNHSKFDLARLDLSVSESEWSQKLIKQVLKDSSKLVGTYTHLDDKELIKKIADLHKVKETNILLSAGSDGALKVLSSFFINNKTNVVIPVPSFGRYEYHAKVNSGKVHFYTETNFPYNFSLEEVAKFANQKKADIVYIANPNNPTGIVKTNEEIENFLRKYKGIVILDEALITDHTKSMSSFISKYPNLVVIESFSKLFGLSGLRIGYILADADIIDDLTKLTSPFEITGISMEIAKKVIDDLKFRKEKCKMIGDALEELSKISNDNISVTPCTSMTCIIKYLGDEDLQQLLYKKGIKTVNGKSFRGLEKENSVRVSVHNKKDIMELVKVLNSI